MRNIETDKQYATRILFDAVARIARLEPHLTAARDRAAHLRNALDAMAPLPDSQGCRSILAALNAELQEAMQDEAEYFNMLQDDYKDRRKMSEWLSAQADRERRAAQA